MLEIKNICKSYKLESFTQKALDKVSLKFRKNEFVSILGQSGSGKTTLLNILGGLDKYDSGDLIINGKSTKNFKDSDWDAYRNNSVGFIFQTYNLISHISILDNVEMGMTLSGKSKKYKRQKALELLEKVGLKEHANKKPNQLSGGQMQRVAIARALSNDPDIILADEPTGALDSKTSIQIMELIKEISKDKLVIMVTHNPELANKYSSRIIELKDGVILNDSNPYEESNEDNNYKLKKTAMNFKTALSLSFNNIRTKKGRTLLTAFASSIGIIGITLILSLSNGFDKQIDIFEADTLSSFPIVISKTMMEVDVESLQKKKQDIVENEGKEAEDYIVSYDSNEDIKQHTNIFTDEYLNYLNKINYNYLDGITYTYIKGMNLLINNNGVVKPVNSANLNMQSLSKDINNDYSFLKNNYDILKGELPKEKTDVLLSLNSQNKVDKKLLEAFNIDPSKEEISFDDLIGKELKLVMNDDYYKDYGMIYSINKDFEAMANSENTITLKITGIVRSKTDNRVNQMMEMTNANGVGGILYTNELMEEYIEKNMNSKIVNAQKEKDYNILTGEKFEKEEDKENALLYLGAYKTPMTIMIYPNNFDSKDKVLNYLDEYNYSKKEKDKIIYNDISKTVISMSSSIMDAITYVLIAFSAVSLVVSSIMIGIITYISVLERTREIGILRSLGARKKDITRVFNAETFLIGLTSGVLGIIIARLLIFPINIIIENLSNLPNVAKLNPVHAIIMIIISILVTLIGGFIPSKMASLKDPVEALRTE